MEPRMSRGGGEPPQMGQSARDTLLEDQARILFYEAGHRGRWECANEPIRQHYRELAAEELAAIFDLGNA